jgi:hypothetical protein
MYAPYNFFKDAGGEEPPRKPRKSRWDEYKGRQRYAPERPFDRMPGDPVPQPPVGKPVADGNPARSMNLWG